MPHAYATAVQYVASPETGGQDAYDLSNLDNLSATEHDTGAILEALQTGAGEMESILAARYPIPQLRAATPSPAALVSINITIARYLMDVRYGARDDVRKRYEDAIARLKRIASNVEDLLNDDGTTLTFDDSNPTPSQGKVGRGEQMFTQGSVRRLQGGW